MNTDEMKQVLKNAIDLLDEDELIELMEQLCPEMTGCSDSRGCGCSRCRDLYSV